MIETLSISPQPSPAEAAAIGAALAQLLAQHMAQTAATVGPTGLRYRDAICGDVPTRVGWRDAARLEALNA